MLVPAGACPPEALGIVYPNVLPSLRDRENYRVMRDFIVSAHRRSVTATCCLAAKVLGCVDFAEPKKK